jgi:Skp family chaperone for outer membrane proteins
MRTMLIALTLAAAAAAATAQEAGRPAGDGSTRIGVVDLDRVGTESVMGKELAKEIAALETEIQAERAKKQADLKRLDAEIAGLQQELDKQAALLSEDGAEKKRQEIKRKGRDRDAYVEDGRVQLEKMTERAQSRATTISEAFRQKLRPYLVSVARQQGVQVLLDSRNAIAVDGAFDLSTAVIAALDAAQPAATAR